MNCLIPIGHFKNGVSPESQLSGAVTVIGRYLILSSFFKKEIYGQEDCQLQPHFHKPDPITVDEEGI